MFSENPKLYSLHYCYNCRKASFHHYKVYRKAICEICNICGQREVIQESKNLIVLHRQARILNKQYAKKPSLLVRFFDWVEMRFKKEW